MSRIGYSAGITVVAKVNDTNVKESLGNDFIDNSTLRTPIATALRCLPSKNHGDTTVFGYRPFFYVI